ncbi:MAG: hypothetical protein ABJP25_02820 [Sneathiella sp.]
MGDAFHRSVVSTKGAAQQLVADLAAKNAENQPLSYSEIVGKNAEDSLLPVWLDPTAAYNNAIDYVFSRKPVTEFLGTDDVNDRAVQAEMKVGETAKELKSIPQVPALQRVAGADGAADTLKALGEGGVLEALEGVAALGAESAVPALTGVGAGLLTKNPTVGALAMGGAAGLQERYAQPIEFFEQRGYDLSKREDVERMMARPELMQEAQRRGLTRAMIIGAVSALSGGVASQTIAKGPVKNMVAQMGVQGGMDMGGEATAGLASDGEVDWKGVILEGLGGLATAPIEVVGLNSELRTSIAEKTKKLPEQVTNEDIINEAAEGNNEAREVLKSMGVGEEQLAAISPEKAQEFAARIQNRRDEDSVRAKNRSNDAGGWKPGRKNKEGKWTKGSVQDEIVTLANEREAVNSGEIDPAAASTAGRILDPDLPEAIPITKDGQGDIGDLGIAEAIRRNRHKPTTETALVPTEPDARAQARGKTDEEILTGQKNLAHRERVNEKLQANRSESIQLNESLYGGDGRQTQTESDFQEQGKARDAFDMTERQRQRSGEGVADTKPGGREGGGDLEIVEIHDGFPVRVRDRMYSSDTGTVEVEVEVERYDPRTGEVEPGAVPYIIEESQLKSARYASNPRSAQDFEDRAEVGRVNKGRASGQRADEFQNLDRQTYRASDPDPNEDFLGAGSRKGEEPNAPHSGRSPFPEQDEGPNPWQERSTSEEDAIRRAKAYAENRERQGSGDQEEDTGDSAFKGKKTSNKAKVGENGYYDIFDHAGVRYVVSDKGGPITFPTQKQAALWIQKTAYKNAKEDQVFTIAAHPFKSKSTGRGGAESLYTVVETKRNDAQTKSVDGEGGLTADGAVREPQEQVIPDAPIDPGNEKKSNRAGVNRPSYKLHSNPFFDPDIYKSIGTDLKALLKGTTALTSTITRPVRRILRALFSSADQDMRADLGERGLLSPTARKILNMFNAEAGKSDGVESTFFESIERRVGEQYGKLDEALGKYRDDSASMKRIVQLLRGNPRAVRAGTPIHDAALSVRKILDEHLNYLRDAGVDIGEIKNGYFPREMDQSAILKDPGGFQSAAAKAYRELGADGKAAREAARQLHDEVVFGHMNGHQGGAATPFVKGRVFGKSVDSADHPLNKFLMDDHVASLSQYINRASKRAEISRRFGDNFKNIGELEQDLISEGAGEAFHELGAHIGSMTGLAPHGMSSGAIKVLQNIRMWSALMYLERATLSSLGEIVMPAVRSGNLADVGTSIVEALKSFKTKDKSETREFAEDLGLITGHLGESIMAARYAGEDINGQQQSKILDRYFRRIGLEQFTEATRIASTKIGNTFIRRLSKDVASKGGKARLSGELLAELGVPIEKSAEFSAWMEKSDGFPTSLDGEMGEIYKTAIWRFVDQTIMRPNKAMKPKAANHPLGQVVYHLQAFTMTFFQNVIKRSGRMAGRAVTEKGLSMQDRARLAAPAMMLPILYGFQAAISEIRDELTMDPERRAKETGAQKAFKWASRTGMFGSADPWLNMLEASSRYQRGAADSLAGPGLGTVAKGIDASVAILGHNSPNTNTQERKAMRALYDVGIEPLFNYIVSNRVGPASGIVTKTGAAALTQLTGSGRTREQFISEVAGPHKKKSKSKKTDRR